MTHHAEKHRATPGESFKIVSAVAVTWRFNRIQIFQVPGGFRAGLLTGYVHKLRKSFSDALNDKIYLTTIL